METIKTQKIRDSRLDLIRTLALLMIITVHTWSLAKVDSHPLLNGIYHAFEGCGVPLFLMISGALCLSAPIDSIRQFYRKRLKRILPPFMGWATLIYIIGIVLHKYEDIQSWQDAIVFYVPYLLTNRINYAYWFVQLIIVLYLLTPFIQQALDLLSRNALRGLLLAWFILFNLQKLCPEIYFLDYTSSLTYYLGYYLAGYYLYTYHKHPDKPVLLVVGTLFAIAFFGIMLKWPVSSIWGPIEHLALFLLLLGIPSRKFAVINWCSQGSYDVYLIHFLFIRPIYMLLHFDGANAPLWQCILIPAATTIVTAALSYSVYWGLGLTQKALGHIPTKQH